MIKILIATILAIFLIGCAGKGDVTKFEPLPPVNGIQQFKYLAKSGVFRPANDPKSEEDRIEWLEMWLKDNNMCANGYVILDRNAASLGHWDSVRDIYYTGQCK